MRDDDYSGNDDNDDVMTIWTVAKSSSSVTFLVLSVAFIERLRSKCNKHATSFYTYSSKTQQLPG